MAKPLTAKTLENLKADPDKRREIPDGSLPGLYFIIQPSGAKSWAVRYRHNGKPRKFTIGQYPAIDLADKKEGKRITAKGARTLAREVLAKVTEGGDPVSEKKAARHESERDLVSVVAEQFLKRHTATKRGPLSANYLALRKAIFDRDIIPAWGKRSIGDIGKRDVLALLDKLTDAGRGTGANYVLAHVRKFFSWAVSRDIIAANPCLGIAAPATETARERVLSDDELRWLWKACERIGYPFGPMTRMLVLTLQRRTEVAAMTRDEIAEGKWTIPAERSKNGKPHDVPLSGMASEVIEGLPKIRRKKGAPSYLFTTNGAAHVSGYSRAKKRLDTLMAEEAEKQTGQPVEIANWTLHDLRRTGATGMQRLGIPLQVVESTLNHVSGSRAGIVGVYQRYEYADEKARALEAWARHVESVLSGKAAKVVSLAEARRKM